MTLWTICFTEPYAWMEVNYSVFFQTLLQTIKNRANCPRKENAKKKKKDDYLTFISSKN